MFKERKKWKSILSVFLCVAMLAGMVSYPINTTRAQNTSPATTKMIHYKHNDNNRGVLGQDIAFEKDTTYTLSFSYSMVTGDYNADTGMYVKVLGKSLTGAISSVNSGYLFSSAEVEGAAKAFSTAEIEGDSKKGIATYTFTWTADDGTGSVFFHVPANKSAEFYFAEMTLYKSDDANKTNLMTSVDETGTFKNWKHTGAYPQEGATIWTVNDGDERYTVTLLSYNANLFLQKKLPRMIHYKHNNNNRGVLGQDIAFEKDTTYTLSFSYSMVTGDYNADTGMYVKILGKSLTGAISSVNSDYLFSSAEVEGTAKAFSTAEIEGDSRKGVATYTFTWTADNGTGSVFFHVPANKSAEFYFAEMTLYKSDDANKTNLMTSVDETGTFKNWKHTGAYPQEGATIWTVNDGNERYTVTLLSYNASLFPEKVNETYEKMIHYKYLKANGGMFGQTVAFEKGQEYTISYEYSMVAGAHNADVGMILKISSKDFTSTTNATSNVICEAKQGSGFTTTKVEGDDKKGIATYTFVWTGDSGNGSVWFHMQGGTSNDIEFYLANVVLCESNDTDETNLMSSVDTAGTLDGWRHPNTVAPSGATEWTAKVSGSDRYIVKVIDYDATLFETDSNDDENHNQGSGDGEDIGTAAKMLHVNVDSATSGKMFGQNAELKADTEYTIVFRAAFAQGKMDDGIRVKVKSEIGTGYTTYFTSQSGQTTSFASNEYDSQTYTYTYTFKNQTAGTYGIGFEFNKKELDFYVTDFEVYETPDEEKANILPFVWKETTLADWKADGVKDATSTDVKFITVDNQGTRLFTAELIDCDNSLFEPEKEAHGDAKMVYFDVKKEVSSKVYGQNVVLKANTNYTISFKAKFKTGKMDNGVRLKVKSELGSGKWKTYFTSQADAAEAFESATVDEQNCTYTYTFTNQEAGTYSVGFEFRKEAIQLYVADFIVYETRDTSKTNILPFAGTEEKLADWKTDGTVATTSTDKKVTVLAKEVEQFAVELLAYDTSIFVPRVVEHSMIYLDVSQEGKNELFGQNVELEKGKTYTVTFRYKFKEGEMDTSVILRVKSRIGSGTYVTYNSSNETGSTGMEGKLDEKTCTATYTFTFLGDSGTYGLGFQFISPTKMYIADATLYEVGDEAKKNLLPSSGEEDTLYGWRADWSVPGIVKEFTNTNAKTGVKYYTATVLPFDENVFQLDPELPPKMLYIENNGTYRQLIQRVKLEIGKTYRFSFCVASPIALKGMVMHTGQRRTIFNNMAPINEPDYTKDYYEVVYEFKIPATYGGEAVDLSNLFVGIQFPAGTIAYVFTPKLWDVSDPEQKNLYKNAGFNKGMDNWAFSWGAWFTAAQEGLGVKEYESEGNFKLQVMEYDESKFVTYYNDSRFDDGEWWSTQDVAKKSVKGTAIVRGKYLTTDKKPIQNEKLLLKSLKESYNCSTDNDGKFSFDELPAGFYTLYVVQEVDGKEEQIKTNFAINIKDGYVVDVNVYSDGSYSFGFQPWMWFAVGGVGILAVSGVGATFMIRRKRKTGSNGSEEK